MINVNRLIEYKDMFYIYSRIHNINKDYRLYFDRKNKLFIILNIAKNNEICLKFKSFNLNFEKILYKTKIENIKKLSQEINDHNKTIEDYSISKSKLEFKDKAKDLINYSNRTNKILQSDINKILGVKND